MRNRDSLEIVWIVVICLTQYHINYIFRIYPVNNQSFIHNPSPKKKLKSKVLPCSKTRVDNTFFKLCSANFFHFNRTSTKQ